MEDVGGETLDSDLIALLQSCLSYRHLDLALRIVDPGDSGQKKPTPAAAAGDDHAELLRIKVVRAVDDPARAPPDPSNCG